MKTLLQIDMAISKLRQEINDGQADREIALVQLTELLDDRAKNVKATAAQNAPTKDI